jgi:hypothetical protein
MRRSRSSRESAGRSRAPRRVSRAPGASCRRLRSRELAGSRGR